MGLMVCLIHQIMELTAGLAEMVGEAEAAGEEAATPSAELEGTAASLFIGKEKRVK
jgi:hypothetical protein